MKPRLILLAVGAIALSALAGCFPSYRSPGSFSVDCRYSHSRPDDPIVHPGHAGMSHQHDFYGNVSTNASSSYVSMTGADTTCRLPADRAGYWTPSAFLGASQLAPTRIAVYYFGGQEPVRSLPRDLRMISGTPSGGSDRVEWTCGFRGSPVATHPFDCSEYARDGDDGVTARLEFPTCWSGSSTGPESVAYADGRSCPEGFDQDLPRVTVRVHYPLLDPCLGATPCGPDAADADNVRLSFASGDYTTFHGDFWNTWHQDELTRLVERCLNAYRECGKQRS